LYRDLSLDLKISRHEAFRFADNFKYMSHIAIGLLSDLYEAFNTKEWETMLTEKVSCVKTVQIIMKMKVNCSEHNCIQIIHNLLEISDNKEVREYLLIELSTLTITGNSLIFVAKQIQDACNWPTEVTALVTMYTQASDSSIFHQKQQQLLFRTLQNKN
jgi:hypothetical protein